MTNPQYQQWQEQYGPWAVITGASSGIGRELAWAIAARGLNVVLVARRQAALDTLASDLAQRFGVDTRVITADLSELADVKKVEQMTQSLEIGLLVASAGFGTTGHFLAGDIEKEINMLNVNCRALMMMSHAFGRRFAQQKRGGLILLSSILAFQGTPNSAHYGATKAYVQMLAEGLHIELTPAGVDVLAVAPGPTNSGFADRANMQMSGAMNAKDLAEPILQALGRRTTVLPGTLSKAIYWGLHSMPRWGRLRLMNNIMGGMLKHS